MDIGSEVVAWRGRGSTVPAPPPQYLRLREFCDLASISYSTARQMVSDHKLRVVTFNGRNLRVPASELTRIMQPKGV
jgi:excisionase family DNA binding protein